MWMIVELLGMVVQVLVVRLLAGLRRVTLLTALLFLQLLQHAVLSHRVARLSRSKVALLQIVDLRIHKGGLVHVGRHKFVLLVCEKLVAATAEGTYVEQVEGGVGRRACSRGCEHCLSHSRFLWSCV